MDAPRPLQLQDRWFLQGMETCFDCGREFSYTLPKEVFLFWSGYCPQCDPAIVFDIDFDNIKNLRIIKEDM